MRVILHCDINNCFASIEMLHNPALRGKAIAVCGNPNERRGIVLAKSEPAKRCGVKTGDTLWEARKKCPDILFVEPHYELYVQYSRAIRRFYESLTERVEPYGLDECWLDLTGDVRRINKMGEDLGNFIRTEVSRRFGLTISVGVSFNKVFAKLGSDYRKPDAVTVISAQNFRSVAWPLPASDLFGVGRSTAQCLRQFGILTIGDIARASEPFFRRILGKNGAALWKYANGLDSSPVCTPAELAARQSMSHITTLPADICSQAEAWPVFLSLATRIAEGLRRENLLTTSISVLVRSQDLAFHQYAHPLPRPTDASENLARTAFMVFCQKYAMIQPARALGIAAQKLTAPQKQPQRLLFTDDEDDTPAIAPHIEKAVSSINATLGHDLIRRAAVLDSPEHLGSSFGRPESLSGDINRAC